MLSILQEAYNEQHIKGGRKAKISLENKLMITLNYYREYRSQFHIAQDFGITESAVCKAIQWVESILINHKDFALPSKKSLWQDNELETILIDARSTHRTPQKKQRQQYSGKKKRRTLKVQIVVDKKSKKILCTYFSKGSTHDFKLYQLSKITTKQSVLIQADSVYQGIQQAHANSQLPKKKTKLKPLTKIDKKANHKLSS